LQLLPVLADHGVQADAHLYNSLMKAHIATSDPAGVLVVLRRMKVDGIDPDLVTYNNLIYGLTRAGLRAGMAAKARTYLNAMAAHSLVPDVITYTSLMNGMCVKDDAIVALGLLQEMEAKGYDAGERQRW
jgi:pentatricopeptide repeat protein